MELKKSEIKNLEENMTDYWGHRSSSYSVQNMSQLFGEKRESWEKMIFDQIDEHRKLKILDIGTGPGFFAILSALRGHDVTAVDMSQEMLDKAKINATLAGVDVHFIKVGKLLPFENETFDLIISRDVTWTLTEPEIQLRHWAEKLKVDGTMLYFDAEWYEYLRDAESKKAWEIRKKNIVDSGGYVYEKAANLEKMASKLPLTYKKRPTWDTEHWSKENGFKCSVTVKLNEKIYSEIEQLQYESFPEFLVCVKRS